MPNEARTDVDRINEQIKSHLKSYERYLLGMEGEPADAFAELDAANELAARLKGPASRFYRAVIEGNRGSALLVTARSREDLEAAGAHLRAVIDELRALRAEESDSMKAESVQEALRGVESKVRLQLSIVEKRLAPEPDGGPAQRRSRRRQILEKMLAELEPDNPYRPFLQGLITFDDSFEMFRESTRAMSEMNLADAARYIEEASGRAGQAAPSSGGGGELPAAVSAFEALFDGFRQLIDAQRAYVETLRDAVLGDVTARHVAALTEADDLLRRGLGRIETSAPVLERFTGVGDGLDPETLRESIDEQRARMRNLRHLVAQGLKPKEMVTRSSPRFFVYFVVTFVVVLFGARWSGLITALGGHELLSVLVIALVVSATSSFGYTVGYRWLTSAFGFLGAGGGESKAEKPKAD